MNTSAATFDRITHLTNANPALLFLFPILAEKLLWFKSFKYNLFSVNGNYSANKVKQQNIFPQILCIILNVCIV